ncbi:MAG: hypothetical protein KNN13_04605 [Hydrogenobacter thermophilus]|uniref:hypothetical protein n=1 Tax=Hydrogenobacter thermophilus TaxID=940 RepID=UPI001C7599AF|nr:hypothetical protein [Hydrogenobacter thermophilus]QWK20603.1 MAG: hypothetical protein KNN13_04605 [Hydrogenobacter thermophilus]
MQPYRAIKQIIEKGKLEKVIVVGSGGNRSSYEQFPEFKEFIINLIPEASRIKIELWEKPVNFNDLEEIHVEFERIYEKLAEEGYKDSDIVLDVTGGTKPVSIAGAATTTPFIDRYFQYVTNEGKLLVFNMEPYS